VKVPASGAESRHEAAGVAAARTVRLWIVLPRQAEESKTMTNDRGSGEPGNGVAALAERLERGGVIYYPNCPFPLPDEGRAFLLEQRLASRAHKNISYDPRSGKVNGFLRHSPEQAAQLREVLAAFSQTATRWLGAAVPRYAAGWQLDRVSLRPEEEATRKLRLTARNDLLHVDAFPSRPTNGARILRLFVNINPSEPRVWVTSEPFAVLLTRYGAAAGLPGCTNDWFRRLLGIFRPKRRRSPYDAFMLRLHNFLKGSEAFQQNCPKRLWHFPPGSAWLAITDTASHAVLRGRYAVEHSYFLPPSTLALPEEAPAALLARACGMQVLHRAA
jgi:hypothetical protein